MPPSKYGFGRDASVFWNTPGWDTRWVPIFWSEITAEAAYRADTQGIVMTDVRGGQTRETDKEDTLTGWSDGRQLWLYGSNGGYSGDNVNWSIDYRCGSGGHIGGYNLNWVARGVQGLPPNPNTYRCRSKSIRPTAKEVVFNYDTGKWEKGKRVRKDHI